MEPNKDNSEEDKQPQSGEQAPADALSRTPDDLAEEKKVTDAAANKTAAPVKQLSPIRRFFRKVNVYFLIFILLAAVAAAVTVVNYLNSQKETPPPDIASQSLTQDALKQLANTDASVGNSSQTLTIQGNAVISGQTLLRGNLNVAGNIQSGGSIQAPSVTVSGTTNLNDTQINSLQVAQNTAIQGTTTLRDLNVSGATSLSGNVTASQITVSRLILSGNASLEVPNHISFTGAAPSRSINNSVLGNGGTLSIDGSDTAGTINVSTGNNPTAGCFGRITFNVKFTNKPHVIVSPIGNAAGQTQFYVDRDTTGFSICTANAAPANQVFAYDYFVTN